MKIEILRGVSGSGKSTYAKSKKDYYVVSRDQIRLDLLGPDGLEKYFLNGIDWNLEEVITTKEQEAVIKHIIKNHNLIIDDTHLKNIYIQAWVNVFYDLDVPFENVTLVEFPIDLEVAKERVSKRDKKPISDEILESQFNRFTSNKVDLSDFAVKDSFGNYQWVPKEIKKGKYTKSGLYNKAKYYYTPFEVTPYVKPFDKPQAVICDLDGTLAFRTIIPEPYPHMRGFFDYDDVQTDGVQPLVKTVLKGLQLQGVEILFVTGRKDECRTHCEKYLDSLGFKDYKLFMRNPIFDSDGKKDFGDDIVKYRLFNEFIRDNYDVIGVLDDRARVVTMWEELGLKVLICAKLNEIGAF